MRDGPRIAAVACLVGDNARAEMLGALMGGQTIYVNDGSCPRNQIRQVTGGDHIRGRMSSCIALE